MRILIWVLWLSPITASATTILPVTGSAASGNVYSISGNGFSAESAGEPIEQLFCALGAICNFTDPVGTAFALLTFNGVSTFSVHGTLDFVESIPIPDLTEPARFSGPTSMTGNLLAFPVIAGAPLLDVVLSGSGNVHGESRKIRSSGLRFVRRC